jgi:hypothetical protein
LAKKVATTEPKIDVLVVNASLQIGCGNFAEKVVKANL